MLQGGGALGAYQCGVYEALHEAGIRPDWFAGTSIGAINAAILAGNAPEQRVERLHEFWNTICEPAGTFAWPSATAMRDALAWLPPNSALSAWLGALVRVRRARCRVSAVLRAARAAAVRRSRRAARPRRVSTTPRRCKATLERARRFRSHQRRRRAPDGRRDAMCATGNFRYFDSAIERIGAGTRHGSGALPPAFPAVVIDGEHYWDGGVVSNTPLEYVLESAPRRDTLAFQVDLWSARGILPRTLLDVLERQKDIQYSSRTRLGTDAVAARQRLRNALGAAARGDSARSICRRNCVARSRSRGCATACSTSCI